MKRRASWRTTVMDFREAIDGPHPNYEINPAIRM